MSKASTSRHAALFMAVLALSLAGGCVLVVGGDGHPRRAEAEWSSSRDFGSQAPAARADGSLAREVEARVRADSTLSGEDITISSNGSTVSLHGRVREVAVLEHAMRIAADVPGVTRVVSRLTIDQEVR